MDDDAVEKVVKIIEKVANVNISEINPDRDLRDQIILDSMQFLTISAHIEEAFNIELPISIINVKTLNDFLKLFKKELASQS
ncbi:acyl carrier protein [Fibrobacterota bacterium]